MRTLDKLRLRLRSVLQSDSANTDLDSELRFHLEREIAANIAAGMSPSHAREAALREFGGVDQIREECSDMRKVNWPQDLVQDVQYGARILRKSPAFAAIAIATLALGIGANTAIFSVVYTVLLRPLPFPNPAQLVFVFEAKPQEGISGTGTSYDNLTEWRAQNHVFADLAAIQNHALTLTGRGGDPADVDTIIVTPELLPLLGARPLAGRIFLAADENRGAAPVVIISENLWRDRFGADPAIIGSPITLDKRQFTVVGIMPAQFRFPLPAPADRIWIPLVDDPLFGSWMDRPGGHWVQVIGRLKPGVSMAQAQAEMDAIAARLAKKNPTENDGWIIRFTPLQQAIVGNTKTALLVLLGAVGLVLLIACANISNLLLARATARSKEIALRIALGAGRPRVLRQLLTESAVLGLLGGAIGVLIAYWGVRTLTALLPPDLPLVYEVRVDVWVLGFALLISFLASGIFGLAPAMFAADSNLQLSLREDAGRAGEPGKRRFARSFLAAAEVALAMVLLVAAGLLLRSFFTLTSVSPGFDAQNLVTAEVSLPQFQYSKPEQWTAFSDELLRRLGAQPGMSDTAMAVPVPLAEGFINLGFKIAGNPPLPPSLPFTADYGSVSPNYFRVMRIPLLRGRFFTDQDNSSTPRVALISEALAHQYFANQDPIGQQLIFGFPPQPGLSREIVGVVGDVRDVSLGKAPEPMMYVPYRQAPVWGGQLVVRSALSPGSVSAAIREQVREVDKDLPITHMGTMASVLDDSVGQPRFRTWLLGLFGLLALILAAAGIFGVISYSVSRRTHEIGIRITLGASPQNVLRLILGESARLVVIGLVIGAAASLALSRYLATLLFGVRATDPLTFAAVAVLLAAVALAAAYVPTRRAMRVDPMVALRHE